MLTEDEAKAKWCHRAPTGTYGHRDSYCMGSACMAWRWIAVANNNSEWAKAERQKFAPNGRGYCGLAGRTQ